VLAALSRAVVVVEAGLRSGALITVDHALDLGLEVWAVPGPIDEPSCAGSNGLLAEGARPLVSVDSFVRDALGVDPAAPTRLEPPALGDEGPILACLEVGARSADEVARETGLGARRVLAALSELELSGRVLRVPGMRFRRAG
jgi:DNA processing protein